MNFMEARTAMMKIAKEDSFWMEYKIYMRLGKLEEVVCRIAFWVKDKMNGSHVISFSEDSWEKSIDKLKLALVPPTAPSLDGAPE